VLFVYLVYQSHPLPVIWNTRKWECFEESGKQSVHYQHQIAAGKTVDIIDEVQRETEIW